MSQSPISTQQFSLLNKIKQANFSVLNSNSMSSSSFPTASNRETSSLGSDLADQRNVDDIGQTCDNYVSSDNTLS